jgi:DNA invertase Pin-like site-specific DNA recombinase
VVVWKLDRLSRSLKDLLHVMEQLADARAGFRSPTEAIDTTTPAGRMLMQMVGRFAEFKRAMMRECIQAGLTAARAHGRIGGRRYKLPQKGRDLAVTMLADLRNRVDDICETVDISRATLYRYAQAVKQAMACKSLPSCS